MIEELAKSRGGLALILEHVVGENGDQVRIAGYHKADENEDLKQKYNAQCMYMSALLATGSCSEESKPIISSFLQNRERDPDLVKGREQKDFGNETRTFRTDLDKARAYAGSRNQEKKAGRRRNRTWIQSKKQNEQVLKVFYAETARTGKEPQEALPETLAVYGKYKSVADKVRPVLAELPGKFRIERNITGDPLKDLPKLPTRPKEFEPTGRYTQERRDAMQKKHDTGFLLPEELKLIDNFMMDQEAGFAWHADERGTYKKEYFPPVEFPVIPHEPWVLKNIPIKPGKFEEICRLVKEKIDAGVYEPSNSSYRSKWFCVVKSDGKSLRIVHSLEPLNAVTIQHSGVPPATEALAEHFAGRACTGVLDVFVGFDNRDIHEDSRDYTTFQTPFGALRLVKLPMGWTNSVPIFHDDTTYIMKDEIPHVTLPYIDDCAVRGPATRYETEGGGFETIPGNKGIRRFVWEHFENLNRVVQRMKYAGGTFSGVKSVLCSDDVEVVGHRCTYEGQLPSEDRVRVLREWGPCKDVSDLRSFLGTCNVMRKFIKDYSKIAEHLQILLRKDADWLWEDKHTEAQENLVKAIEACPALRSLRYEWDSPVYLAVDTSYKAVGYYIYQVDPEDPTIRYYARFNSITLNETQARFSQPKRELFGLKAALEACEYWLAGCRKLVVETDAKYIKGMLSNPGRGPNATIDRWIEEILMFHFKLKHVKGATFPADGLSRKDPSPNDQRVDPKDDGPIHEAFEYEQEEGAEDPLEFESFKTIIDTRGGYYQTLAQSVEDVEDLKERARETNGWGYTAGQEEEVFKVWTQDVIDTTAARWGKLEDEDYPEEHRTAGGISFDSRLPLLKRWLNDPSLAAKEATPKEYDFWKRKGRNFFVNQEGKLYRRGIDGEHRMVIDQKDRMYVLRSCHDTVGHRGFFATKAMICKRFWWPEVERDIKWFIETCHMCQVRKRELVRIPPVVTHTPSLFQRIIVDSISMSPPSNGCAYILEGRDTLTQWVEARAVKKENARTVAMWLMEEWIYRWGCMFEIASDNGGPYVAALKYLKERFGISGIRIAPYNHIGAGKIERPHWDIRQSLYKATGGDTKKWYYFLNHVLWADRILVRRGLGCSSFFAVTGANPVTPLDIMEATWLVDMPGGPISTADLIGLRAKALAKHTDDLKIMRARLTKEKIRNTLRYEKEHAATIVDYHFSPGDLVLIRHTEVEFSLDKKMKPRYLGPMVVIRVTKGRSYIVAELDGAVYHNKIARFRVIPYNARKKITIPDNIHEMIDLSERQLEELENEPESLDEYEIGNDDLIWDGVRLNTDEGDEVSARPKGLYDSDSDEGVASEDSEPEEDLPVQRRSKRLARAQ